MRRTRGRSGNGQSNYGNGQRRQGSVPSRHQVFDSNGPDVRIRGNAWQVYDKYLTLARDAQASGDRVKTESYLQHAEHYYRIMLAIQEATGEMYQQRTAPGSEDQPEEAAVVEGQIQSTAQPPQGPTTLDMTDQPEQEPQAAVA